MSKANKRQVGGTHYQMEYQHWDLVEDIQCGYLIGCATKYLSRWRNKNGILDLEKAIHYLEKYIERGHRNIFGDSDNVWDRARLINRFGFQLHPYDRRIFFMIMRNNILEAIEAIRELISDEIHGPDASYVNQDLDLKGE